MPAYVIVSLAVAALAIVFSLQNNIPTAVQFLAWKFEGSLAIIFLAAVAAGVLIGFFASLPAHLRTRWNLRAARKRVEQLESTVAKLTENAKPAPPPAPDRDMFSP